MVVSESALDDDLHTALHRGDCVRDSGIGDLDAIDANDLNARSLEMLDVSLLMSGPPFREDLQERVPDLGLGNCALRDCAIEPGQMSAVEMPDDITRTE